VRLGRITPEEEEESEEEERERDIFGADAGFQAIYEHHFPSFCSAPAAGASDGGETFFAMNLRLAEKIQNLLWPGPLSLRNS